MLVALIVGAGCRPGASPSAPTAAGQPVDIAPPPAQTNGAGPAQASGAPSLGGGAPRLWSIDLLEGAGDDDPSLSAVIAALEGGAGSAPGGGRAIVVAKPAYGPAGIVPFLRSTADVAPERLPDLCVLPLEALPSLRAEGLLRPIADAQLSAMAESSFPFARDLVSADGQVWAIPLAAGVLHAIAREQDVPAQWSEDGSDGPLALPLGGDATPPDLAALVSLYAGAGGDLAALPEVDPVAARAAFEFVSRALAEQRLVLPEGGPSPRAAWSAFVAGAPRMALVDAGSVVAHQAGYPGMRWGPAPGLGAASPTLAWGWAVALVERGGEPQAGSLALLARLGDPAMAAPILAAGLLPARPEGWEEAVEAALEPDPGADYLAFLLQSLEQAHGLAGLPEWGPYWAAAGLALAEGTDAASALAQLTPEEP